MIPRRLLLSTGASLLATGFGRTVLGQATDIDYEDVAVPFPTGYKLFGTNPALGPEEDEARKILEGAPKGATPLETARYFEAITQTNADGQTYNAQWPKRWNPVIVGFYQSTLLDKKYVYRHGDTTPWCAAFMNWCLGRGGYHTTSNASSGSFRIGKGLGEPTQSPQAGDIIVFKSADPQKTAVGHGHVAIFLEKLEGGFRVLGGNQKAGKKYSSVNTGVFREKSNQLVFDSIRSLTSIGKLKS